MKNLNILLTIVSLFISTISIGQHSIVFQNQDTSPKLNAVHFDFSKLDYCDIQIFPSANPIGGVIVPFGINFSEPSNMRDWWNFPNGRVASASINPINYYQPVYNLKANNWGDFALKLTGKVLFEMVRGAKGIDEFSNPAHPFYRN